MHTCVCGAQVEKDGQHAFVCNKLKSRHARNTLCNNDIRRAFAAGEIPTRLEPTGMCSNDEKRPDGITLVPWSSGRALVWDFTCVHRQAASYSSSALKDGPAVANLAESNKLRKYQELEQSHIVQPVAAETLGGLGESTLTFLRELGARIRSVSDQKRSAEFLRQRLGISIQIGNAAAVMETFGGAEDPLDIDFVR